MQFYFGLSGALLMNFPIDGICPALFAPAPVCGYDGNTYPSECELNLKNIKKQYDGVCKCKCTGIPPVGCPAPQTCSTGFEWGGCPQLCDQATCNWKILNPGCVPISPKPTFPVIPNPNIPVPSPLIPSPNPTSAAPTSTSFATSSSAFLSVWAVLNL